LSKIIGVLVLVLTLCVTAMAFLTGLLLIGVHIPEAADHDPDFVKSSLSIERQPQNFLEWLFPANPYLAGLGMFVATLVLLVLVSLFLSYRARNKIARFAATRTIILFGYGLITAGALWLLVAAGNNRSSGWLYWPIFMGALILLYAVREVIDEAMLADQEKQWE
jgi:hypothetical protein